jgi:hypothetical protein
VGDKRRKRFFKIEVEENKPVTKDTRYRYFAALPPY